MDLIVPPSTRVGMGTSTPLSSRDLIQHSKATCSLIPEHTPEHGSAQAVLLYSRPPRCLLWRATLRWCSRRNCSWRHAASSGT
eukprot:3572305-Pyramimonas_sp.AAC.1